MRALLASPLGVLVGVSLGALGGGGSILAVPVLVFVAGQAPAAATTTSLVVVGVASLTGAYGHWRAGRVRVGPGLVFGLVGLVGSLAGSALNRRLDGDVLLLGFAGLVLVVAWRMAAGGAGPGGAGGGIDPPPGTAVRTRRRTVAPAAQVVAAGTAVGFLTGLFGVGGGFIIVPALALVLCFPMPEAVGTSLLVIAVNCAMALGARLGSGGIEWSATLAFTAAAVAGVGMGKRIADHLAPDSMRRWFAALLAALALYTGARAGLALL